MRKKILSLALALAMCLGLMAVPAAAVNPGEEWVGDFVVKGDTLVKYYGEDSVVTVPGGITKIGTNAFEDCVSLKSVTIPVYSLAVPAWRTCLFPTALLSLKEDCSMAVPV